MEKSVRWCLTIKNALSRALLARTPATVLVGGVVGSRNKWPPTGRHWRGAPTGRAAATTMPQHLKSTRH